MYSLIKPFLFLLPPEVAHHMAIFALRHLDAGKPVVVHSPVLTQSLWGLTFNNPVGMAAGFDKNAEAIYPLLRRGFGFVEVGTVTPKPQSGNPRPRLFRLEKDEAVINRMGFNNKGVFHFEKGLRKFPDMGIVGANIGKNKTQDDPIADYNYLLERFYGKSDYITINISSPNTPGLRNLQAKDELDKLLSAVMGMRNMQADRHGFSVPILLKIAPDISEDEQKDIASAVITHKVDGLIVSNTTTGLREDLQSSQKTEAGGLSGKPLFELSTNVLSNMYRHTEGKIPLVGVGGIASAEDAYRKIRAGASLVQLYSALVYHGFELVNQVRDGLIPLLERDGFSHISEAVGADHK